MGHQMLVTQATNQIIQITITMIMMGKNQIIVVHMLTKLKILTIFLVVQAVARIVTLPMMIIIMIMKLLKSFQRKVKMTIFLHKEVANKMLLFLLMMMMNKFNFIHIYILIL